MLDTASDADSSLAQDGAGEIRLLAASADAPLARALRSELEAMEPAARPHLIALLRRTDDEEAQALEALGGSVRRLTALGGDGLREHIQRADELWLGKPVSEQPTQADEARRLARAAAPDAFDAARLAFETAWALSAPTALEKALEPYLAHARKFWRSLRSSPAETSS